MRTLALAALLCAGSLHAMASAAPATPALRDRLLATTQAWVDAIPRGDQAVWQRTLSDDAVLIDEFGRIQHKPDAVASLHRFPPGLSGNIELRNAHAWRHGDAALLQVEEYERETVFGQKLVVCYQSLLTFVKQQGAWKIAGYEDVTLPTAPPELRVPALAPGDYVGTYRYAPDRAWTVSVRGGVVGYATGKGRPFNALDPLARDVFMGTDDERNLLIFRRDAGGRVVEMIERRKFNDLRLKRDADRARR